MYSYVARQPILNRKLNTVGHELLFRNGEHNAFPSMDENEATSRLVLENFLSAGLNPNVKSVRSFINFPHDSLINLIPLSLPAGQIVIEVLETCTPNSELFSAIKHLYRKGYIIALDDFNPHPDWNCFLPFIHVIKLDIMQLGILNSCDYVKQQKELGAKCKFLAERVETYDEYHMAREAGFDLFQGYFFSKPEVVKNRSIKAEQLLILELFQQVSKPEVDFATVEQIIIQDAPLSYQLLRFVNTSLSQLESPISSFKQALIYLGEERLKIFVSVIATAQISNKKPRELYRLSLRRARFCDLISAQTCGVETREQAFMTGLFSLLDSLFDHSIVELVSLLPVNQEIKQALLQREGVLGNIISLQEAYEHGDWLQVRELCQQLEIEESVVQERFSWADSWSCTYTLS
ncbi:EAL and HDOD domain-containing protein [Aliivibrio kagoshimensis]|uniref:EAL and HDOD domain-containing protein n=1 Tax=Aliivibrio kagoshimensis TaxID=2910230 RepID=UPI003D0D4991